MLSEPPQCVIRLTNVSASRRLCRRRTCYQLRRPSASSQRIPPSSTTQSTEPACRHRRALAPCRLARALLSLPRRASSCAVERGVPWGGNAVPAPRQLLRGGGARRRRLLAEQHGHCPRLERAPPGVVRPREAAVGRALPAARAACQGAVAGACVEPKVEQAQHSLWCSSRAGGKCATGET